MKKLYVYLSIILSFVFISCSDIGSLLEPEELGQLAENVAILSSDEVLDTLLSFELNTTNTNNTQNNKLVFSASSTNAAKLKENDVIFSDVNEKLPFGMLQKVVSKTTNSNDEIVVETVQAEIFEAIEKGKGSATGRLYLPNSLDETAQGKVYEYNQDKNFPNFSRPTYFAEGVSLSSTTSPNLRAFNETLSYDENLTFANGDLHANSDYSCEGTGLGANALKLDNVVLEGFRLNGCIGIFFDYDVDYDIDASEVNLREALLLDFSDLKFDFKFLVTPQILEDIEVTYEPLLLGFPKNVALEKVIFSHQFKPSIKIPTAAGIPIIIDVGLDVVIGATGQVRVRINTRARGKQAFTVGGTKVGRDWNPIWRNESNPVTFTEPTISNNNSLEIYVGPQINFLFYGVAGPELYGNVFLAIESDTAKTPWWTLGWGLRFGLGLELSLKKVGFDGLALSYAFPDILKGEWLILQAEPSDLPETSDFPDLVVESFSLNGNSSSFAASTGQTLTLNANVKNQGSRSSSSGQVRYYLSSDAIITPDDREVGVVDNFSALSVNSTSSQATSVEASLTPGTYYYGACVDVQDSEINKNNNCSDAVRVDVSGQVDDKNDLIEITDITYPFSTISGTVGSYYYSEEPILTPGRAIGNVSFSIIGQFPSDIHINQSTGVITVDPGISRSLGSFTVIVQGEGNYTGTKTVAISYNFVEPIDGADDKPINNNLITRNPALDFNTLKVFGNISPRGIWSDGITMWVVDLGDKKIYAYNMATKARDSNKDFNTLTVFGNTNPVGIWSDGTTMWVSDSSDNKIYAYNMSTKDRDSTKEFNTLKTAGNNRPTGIWSDGTTMWVADESDGKLYAYNLATKARDSGKDFNTTTIPSNIWSDGSIMWVVYNGDRKLYAYNLATKARDNKKGFTVGNWSPRGIWSNGTTMWISDSAGSKIYAYNLDF